MYKLTGELKVINPVQQVSDSFKKREFVVVDASGQYAQYILLQAVQERCDLLDKFKPGDQVDVTFFLRGREWTNPKDGQVRYFNSLDAWKIEPAGSGSTTSTANSGTQTVTAKSAETFVAEGDDDLPF
ncbi:MAG: DUF3127 domain-containing protein [Crocinitomicaceae bacterium]|nr:DUF3127 domain-containing protein [Crocinitomicaceae bacterium]MBK8926466.1 DUF3127 domain-containing protein [Crocinitomicaceae bacterium]